MSINEVGPALRQVRSISAVTISDGFTTQMRIHPGEVGNPESSHSAHFCYQSRFLDVTGSFATGNDGKCQF